MIFSAPKPMIVAGVMSGTSADGVDVALCRISPALGGNGTPRIKVLGHRSFAYDKKLRASILEAASSTPLSAASLTQLSWRLGEVYGECVEIASREFNLKPQLVACHGQTIYHQAVSTKFLGRPLRCTSQVGEASALVERLKISAITDFRPADLAAGGQGAPLVPMLDYCLFRHQSRNRLLLNLGGIANVSALPAGCGVDGVLAFDTGPANMIIDAAMQRLYGRSFDKNGATAGGGRVLNGILNPMLQARYFAAQPPKSCGREEFGAKMVDEFLNRCADVSSRRQDAIATATTLTTESIHSAYQRFCEPHLMRFAPGSRITEMYVAGGGAHNATLMKQLTEAFAAHGIKVATTASAGLAIEAKEAAAFALLGWLAWHGLPGNVPTATGASRAVVLGKVTFA